MWPDAFVTHSAMFDLSRPAFTASDCPPANNRPPDYPAAREARICGHGVVCEVPEVRARSRREAGADLVRTMKAFAHIERADQGPARD